MKRRDASEFPEIVSSRDLMDRQSRFIERTPENKFLFVMQWYCTEQDCVVREVEINVKLLDRSDRKPERPRCPCCRSMLEFHGYVNER